MDHAEHKTGFGPWLHRAWNALMCAFEGMDRSPLEELADRLDRLERKMAARD